MAKHSPMMRQYLNVKDRYPGTIVFFRLGDFYEMFFEDAKLVSGLLDLTLTARDSGDGDRAPMCGVPHHAASGYINRLVERGYKVAICEQMTDPATSRGLVEREVIRVVTPGTVVDPELLDDKRSRYIAAVCAGKKAAGVAYADVSTGEFAACETSLRELPDTLARIDPAELIADQQTKSALEASFSISPGEYESAAFSSSVSAKALNSHFGENGVDELGELPLARRAAGGLLAYIMETQRNGMRHITRLKADERSAFMGLDRVARRNLELTETISGGKGRGTLFHLLDETQTSMGGRELRTWIENPLTDSARIRERHDAVEELFADEPLAHSIRDILKNVCDLERLLSKISYKTLNPRDCLRLAETFGRVPELLRLTEGLSSALAAGARLSLNPMDDLRNLIERMISPDAPALASEAGVIREGYNEELDKLRGASRNGRDMLSGLEARERELTGVRSLKVVYNRVFGYLIELTNANTGQAPGRYQRRQTLSNAERYTTDELQEIESLILTAQERAGRLETQLYNSLIEWLGEHIPRMQKTARAIELLDALCSLAVVAARYDYVRPSFNDEGIINIHGGRHPVVETMLDGEPFVPNDTLLDIASNRFQIVTGPNMAGKSTYMRQVALIVLMAQAGSFVPAESANLCAVDKMFTRVGASDDLAAGRSTFMVEMSETAAILRDATPRSLILLDEIGRGTATFDGLSIAWAIVEHVAGNLRAKTMFATHYHELSDLEGKLDGVVNYYARVVDRGESLVFLRRIERGSADRSFGVHAARLAGLPKSVVTRAQSILARIEAANAGSGSISRNVLGENRQTKNAQLALGESERAALIEELRTLDVTGMTPMQALNLLFLLHEKSLRL